jgi:hypothetical protein
VEDLFFCSWNILKKFSNLSRGERKKKATEKHLRIFFSCKFFLLFFPDKHKKFMQMLCILASFVWASQMTYKEEKCKKRNLSEIFFNGIEKSSNYKEEAIEVK